MSAVIIAAGIMGIVVAIGVLGMCVAVIRGE